MMLVKTTPKRHVDETEGASSAEVGRLRGEVEALRRELALHDMLVGRSGVRYGPPTENEWVVLRELVDDFTRLVEDDPTTLDSIPQHPLFQVCVDRHHNVSLW